MRHPVIGGGRANETKVQIFEPVNLPSGTGPAKTPLLKARTVIGRGFTNNNKINRPSGPCPPSSWTWSSPATSPYCCPVIGVGLTNEKQEPTCDPCPPSSWTWPSSATSPYCCPVIGVGLTNEKQEPTCGPCPPSSWTWPSPTTFFLTLST
jgi:hypothetical protein